MDWTVNITKKCSKKFRLLPSEIQFQFSILLKDLIHSGPIVKWKNFGKLKGLTDTYHCHIKKGKPSYVVVWEVRNKTIKLMEVPYVGTHEKAPY
jgi:mRNA-degrading endonuclease RelE of RelBE toxin-antitoxin system